MKTRSWLHALPLLVVCLTACGTTASHDTAPPYDFERDEMAPPLPFGEPVVPVVVGPLGRLPAELGGDESGRDVDRRLEGPLEESEIVRLQNEALAQPVDEGVQVLGEGGSRAPTPVVGFEALDFSTAGGNFVPPDPELAVGPNHVMAVVNDYLQIYDRMGTPLITPVRFATFFAGIPGCMNMFDPNVLYDEQLDRFVVGIDANATGYCVAMSQGPDPLLTWSAYGFATVPPAPPGTQDFFDYPHAGVGQLAVFVGANIFNNTASTFLRAEVWAVDKLAMFTGTTLPAPAMQTVVNGFTPQPMNAHGWAQGTWPSTGLHYIVANQYIPGSPPVYSGDLFDVWSWADPFGANVFNLVGPIDLLAATGLAASYPIDAPQVGSVATLQANDWRILDAEYRNGDVWMTQTISCNPGMGTVDCVRWAELDPTIPWVLQAGVFASIDEWRIFPDAAVNHCDDLTIGYTKTSPGMIPSIGITGRLGSDPPGSLQPEALLRPGDLPYTAYDTPPHRWGDYTGGTSDPDGVGTWYLGEYSKLINPPPLAYWGTYVGGYTTSCGVDLAVTKSDGASQAIPGTQVTYTITVGNQGRGDAIGATVSDAFPASFSGVSWTCTGQSGPPTSTCSVPGGTGNVSMTADLQVGSAITITAVGTVDSSATGTLANTATALPVGIVDPVPGNNAATDSDALTPVADLEVRVTDGVCFVLPGGSTTYAVVVDNHGPSDAPAAVVSDTPPAVLTVNSWTCSATGSATCGAPSGSGPLSDSPSLPSGGAVTYSVSATVSASASGTLLYTVTASPGAGVTDPDSSNDSGGDVNALETPIFCDDFDDGTSNAWSATVP